MYYVVGLGNPGEQYERTRHNVGMIVADGVREELGFAPWERDGARQAEVSRGTVNSQELTLIKPTTYMNRSGEAIKRFVERGSEDRLVVIHDDIDLPRAELRLSYNRGAGGHRGVQSIEKALGSKAFLRVRVGVSPVTLFGTMKKPRGEEAVHRLVLGRFSSRELRHISASALTVRRIVELFVTDGRERTMSTWKTVV